MTDTVIELVIDEAVLEPDIECELVDELGWCEEPATWGTKPPCGHFITICDRHHRRYRDGRRHDIVCTCGTTFHGDQQQWRLL